MNYNSVEEILAAGITNMEVIRDNSKQDDGTDTVTGADWFTFNNAAASSIYASGNTWLGFGSNSEHLRVNRRDAAMWYLYREEGTLSGIYKFLKIRWSGYSYYNKTSDSYKLTYDVILWDSGNISLHMVDIPSNSYDGTFQLAAGSSVDFTAPTAANPDVTFRTQGAGNTVYTAESVCITIDPPYDKRYLVRAIGTLYTVSGGALTALSATEITAALFRASGCDAVPDTALFDGLTDPEILYFADTTEYEIKPLTAVQKAVPVPQTIETPDYDMTYPSIFGISGVQCEAGSGVRFAVSFDSGASWKEWSGSEWAEASEGMTAVELAAVTADAWNSAAATDKYRFRATLPDKDNYVKSLIVNYINE